MWWVVDQPLQVKVEVGLKTRWAEEGIYRCLRRRGRTNSVLGYMRPRSGITISDYHIPDGGNVFGVYIRDPNNFDTRIFSVKDRCVATDIESYVFTVVALGVSRFIRSFFVKTSFDLFSTFS